MPKRYSPREAGVEVGSFLHDYYKQMIEKKEISESALKSTINPDYKPKGKKLLSNYRTTKITEEFIKANKKDYPFLKHIRTSPDTESCMWLDGKNPVAVVVVRKESEIYTWITSIDIFPRYRGYGLSYQILDYATKKMGANCLTVAKDNEVAKKVYVKYGFREILIDPKQNTKVTYMALPGTLKESAYMNPQSVVYFTRDITPESLVKIYEALGIDLPGKVMVKINSGEPGGHHFLSPELIAPLVKKVNGTICDANTAYEGKRHRTRDHRQVMHDHGFDAIAPTDILDATGDKAVPVRNGYHLEEVRIGNQTDLYDSVLVLSHFKGHAMAGFGGALKNVAIGMASASGKALVHTAGKSDKTIEGPQQDFLRSMVDSISGITNYIGKDKFVYINIANNLSVDCDCDAHPAPPTMKDIGIFASTDPVAVDQACIDAVYFAEDSKDLITRIKRQTGLNILKYAAEHGIGSRRYQIVDMDRPQNLFNESTKPEKERIKLNGDEIEVHRKVTENPNDPVDKTAHDLTFYLDGKMLAQISISAVNSKKAFLYNFEVVESHRGKGYGTAILKWVMKNYKVNELTVDKDNARAIDLYKKFGFKIGKEFKEDGKTRIDMKINMNESFAPCERLKDAIDNVFSHNALVQLWTPAINDTNGEKYNFKLWDGEAWRIPEEYLDLDILSIDDIVDDEHIGYINIIIDSVYVPMEESAKSEKLYPVYITLFSNDTNFGKLIRKATGSEYSHATVALDPTMNNMYSFSDIPYNEAKFFCAGFVRESIWSPEYTKNRHFRVLVTFVDKVGKDKIKKKIDHFINNFEKYNYNDIGLVQYYFKFKNTKKHDETKKMRWFCSEFVSAMVNASDETKGFENILASPQDLLGKPNVIDLGKFTIPEFNEEELVRKTRTAEKEFRKHANLSKSVVNESADEWLYEIIDESALNEIFNKAKSKKPKFDERQVQKYTFNLDWKLLYEKFKELFPKNDPSMRFDLFGVIVRYFLIPTKAAAVNVTQQIIDQMVKIASFVKNGFIKLIDAVSSLIFFQGEDGDDVMHYPDGPMHEAANTINEIVNSKVDFKEIRKIVDNLSPKEKKWLYSGSTFKDSPYVVYRDIQYKNVLDKKHGGFLEAYIFPKEKNNIYVSIAVDKESRRLGIADLLMNRFMLVIQAFCPNKTVIWKVRPDNIASIELAKKHGFTLGDDGDYIYQIPDNDLYESTLNEYMHTSQIDSREERDKLMAKYGLRQGGYGQRTSKEDEDRMKKSAEWEKKIPLKQRKKIYREDGHPEELIPSHEEVRDPVDDCLPIAEAASDSEIEKLLELNRKLNKYDYIDNSTGKNYKLRSPSQFESDHGGVCWDFVVYQADQFKKLGITNYKTYYVVFDKAPNYPTHTFQIIKLNNQYVYFESSYIRIRGIWMAKSSNDLISFVINTMIKQTQSLKDARYEVREYNPSEGKLIGMNAVEFMNYMNEKKFASFRYVKDPKIVKIHKPEDLNETAAVADDTKGDDNNFHNGNKLIHWYDGWTADGCQFDLEGVAEGEPGAYRFEVDIDSQDEWMGTIHNLNNPNKSLITEAMERVLVDPTNKAMVQKYRDLGYEFIPGVKNRGKAQPMFKTDRSKPDKLYPVYVVLFYSGTALGKLIKAAAGPHFSHAVISFTEDLTEMYSFGRKSGLNVEAFVVDSIENEAYQRPDTQYAIYMIPATADQYDRMKDRINWFIKNAAKFKYNFSGLFKNYLGVSDNPKYRYFCSQFVADILNVADPAKPYFADPSLVTPENFIYTTFAQYIVSGPLSEFDPEHVRKITDVLLAREIKNRNATFKNESVSIPYSKPLTIRFTNDKIPIVTKGHYNRINSVYNDAEKIIQNDESDDRLVTDTMCKLTYAIEIMDRYLTKSLGRKDELYKNMIQLRSKILKLIMQGHKRMMSSSESYDFQEIYNKSKYAEVPKTSAIIGEELRTLL